jgi:hypothetical protein
MMKQLGFAEEWITLVMKCVATVSYSILVNGVPSKTIIPTRRIRLGDPLSLYLFLLCAECLSSLLANGEQEGKTSGIPIAANGGFRLSHLFFADDNLFFCRANFQEWGLMLGLLMRYELASGQNLNTANTSIFFSNNTGRAFRELIGFNVGETAIRGYEKYLGLLAMVGWAKTSAFASIVGKVQARLEGWKERLLSQAGRKILLKAAI